ncbi:MAG: hypothetical protein E6J25_06450 [Chloroflexi bacterium]|nr:MAG: hypothetical protein E6J25_06450 [Chloroflexota bacterium]
MVSTWVAAADVPVTGARLSVVSLAVVLPFSDWWLPAWEAAEPAEFCVSAWVAAGEEPVWGALPGEVTEFVPVWPPAVCPEL